MGREEAVEHGLTLLDKLVEEVCGEKGLRQDIPDEGQAEKRSGSLVVLLEYLHQPCWVGFY